MPRSIRYNWPELLAEFEQSDLSQVAFCKERGIDSKYFNQQRNKHLRKQAAKFTEVKTADSTPNTDGLVLQLGQCKILCPSSMSVNSLVSLVRALA